ncbi:hypothetical protein MNB_SV-6-683 [hydrothermal vent metagenome]|uniref:DUF4412 domain-containing protein n=1 Tax=hydrothermal vent metagenome TaxID=652676 RepID=A0A1W1BU80_9ZZZZ
MTRLVNISIAFLVASGVSMASDKMYQKFGVKSGKITYRVTSSANIMGISSKTLEKKRVIFADYGIRELKEESKVTKQNGKMEKSHTISYMDRDTIYNVDFNKKRITKMKNPAIAMLGLSDDNTAQKAGLNLLKRMGGKKIGKDSVLGYECDVWDAMGTKQCMYKGIPLKIESNIMGVKSSGVATKIDFDAEISDSDFELPKFPIYNEMGEKWDSSKASTTKGGKQDNGGEVAEQLSAIASMFKSAASSAGVKDGASPTKSQQKQIESAIMESMLPKMKEQFISQEKVLLFGKECLSSAKTLKEANICNKKANDMSGENEADFETWDEKSKKEILKTIDESLASIECVKKANSRESMDRCFSNQ